MAIATGKTPGSRWRVGFLAALTAVVAVFLGAATASAVTTPGSENRVRASTIVYGYDVLGRLSNTHVGVNEQAPAQVRISETTGPVSVRDSGFGVAAKTTALTERQIGSKMDDLLEGTSLFKQSKSTQYLKPGGFEQANRDFDVLTRGVTVTDRGGSLRTATLSNGTKVNVRPFSSGKYPTLEVDTPGNPLLKIRY